MSPDPWGVVEVAGAGGLYRHYERARPERPTCGGLSGPAVCRLPGGRRLTGVGVFLWRAAETFHLPSTSGGLFPEFRGGRYAILGTQRRWAAQLQGAPRAVILLV